MCLFVTAVLASVAPDADLDAIARSCGRRLRPAHNPSVQRLLRPDQRYFLTTPGHCDCDTALGAGRRRKRNAPDWAAERQRLLKQRWSTAKVDRSLAQRRDRIASADAAAAEASSSDCVSWERFIAAVLDSGNATEIGLLLHLYSGPLDADIDLQATETMAASEVSHEVLRDMREDVLYMFLRTTRESPRRR